MSIKYGRIVNCSANREIYIVELESKESSSSITISTSITNTLIFKRDFYYLIYLFTISSTYSGKSGSC